MCGLYMYVRPRVLFALHISNDKRRLKCTFYASAVFIFVKCMNNGGIDCTVFPNGVFRVLKNEKNKGAVFECFNFYGSIIRFRFFILRWSRHSKIFVGEFQRYWLKNINTDIFYEILSIFDVVYIRFRIIDFILCGNLLKFVRATIGECRINQERFIVALVPYFTIYLLSSEGCRIYKYYIEYYYLNKTYSKPQLYNHSYFFDRYFFIAAFLFVSYIVYRLNENVKKAD